MHAAFGKDVTPISKILGILSDPVRLHILLALAVQELCVCVLVEITDHKYSALSYHLKLLKEIELVDSRREGTFLLYRLTETRQGCTGYDCQLPKGYRGNTEVEAGN